MCFEIGGNIYYMTKREKLPQPCTASHYQVRIILKNYRSRYSSSSLTIRKKKIYSRDLNKQNKNVQFSDISFHEGS